MPIVIAILWFGHPLSTVTFALIMVAALSELYMITQKLSAALRTILFLCGFMYVGFAFKGIYEVIKFAPIPTLVIQLTLLVWVSDTGGFFWGRLIQGPRLAPKISPNKTWAGAIGALLMTVLVMQVFQYLQWGMIVQEPIQALYVGILVSSFVQFGDLLESAFKRFLEIKDSGRLIPGHGGLWDRLDGYFALFFVIGVTTCFMTLERVLSLMGVQIS